MEYLISSEDYRIDSTEQLCSGAVYKAVDRIEVRTITTFEEFNWKFGKREGTWLSKGTDHCINDRGYIQRTFPKGELSWVIEINSLEQLQQLITEVGNIKLTPTEIILYD